jgi:glucoamylase
MTIAQGNLSEVFFPTLDWPALHGLRFLVAAPGSPPVDDAREAGHRVSWLEPGIPTFSVETVHPEYQLRKDFCCDPERNAILIAGDFKPQLPDLKLYLQASAHLVPGGEPNDAHVLDRDPPLLALRQGSNWIVIAGPFDRASAGYVNSSDIYVELHDCDGRLEAEYDAATAGNVAVGAQLGLESGLFQLAIGLAHSQSEAEEIALDAMEKGMAAVRDDFVAAWKRLPGPPPNLLRVSGDGGALARASLTVLRCLEDKDTPGAFIAAPAAPWGESQGAGDHVYHLVWPRDLFQMATALMDIGELDAGRRALAYLAEIQLHDGSWPQNCTVSGLPHWNGSEMDEVAYPILLAWRLGLAGGLEFDPYPDLVRPAAEFILRNGPSTQLDRWEDAGGLSASTLAVVIAALCAAAEFAEDASDYLAAGHMRAVADYWNDRIEAWCYLRAFRHYVRLGYEADSEPDLDAPVSLDFLELVRRGLRRPDDARIRNSFTTADALLRCRIDAILGWRRYVDDGYGETDDGAPWSLGGAGRGRCWPLLTGEVAHHRLAIGDYVGDLVAAMEGFAGEELMLPEQIWDGEALPQAGLEPGRATGSAAPLGWAHAEYLKLLAAISTETLPDLVGPAKHRFVEAMPREPAFVWSHAHQIGRFLEGRAVRVQLQMPAQVRWSADGWASFKEVTTTDTTLGLWVAELPTQIMRPGASIEWTAYYQHGWEGRNYTLTCAGED